MSPETDTELDESVMLGDVQHLLCYDAGGMPACGAPLPPEPGGIKCAECIECEEDKRRCVCGLL